METFLAGCFYEDDKYIFFEDGTMRYIIGGELQNGTYLRDGDIITFKLSEKDDEFKLLIFNNGVNSSVYYKK